MRLNFVLLGMALHKGRNSKPLHLNTVVYWKLTHFVCWCVERACLHMHATAHTEVRGNVSLDSLFATAHAADRYGGIGLHYVDMLICRPVFSTRQVVREQQRLICTTTTCTVHTDINCIKSEIRLVGVCPLHFCGRAYVVYIYCLARRCGT